MSEKSRNWINKHESWWNESINKEIAFHDLERILDDYERELRLSDVSGSLIGKKVIWKGKEYTIVDKHNDSDFIMIDDENSSVVGLHWKDVELVD